MLARGREKHREALEYMEKSIRLRDKEECYALFGERDRHLKMIRGHFDVKIFARDNNLRIAGEEQGVLDAYVALLTLIEKVRKYGQIRTSDVESALLHMEDPTGSEPEIAPLGLQGAKPLTPGQEAYIEAIKSARVVFGVGPAGTGKTYLATSMAVAALIHGNVSKVVLVRPAVEAGEKLGFLPGDFQAKVNPYLRPIFDALGAMLPMQQIQRYIERDVIEVAPLAYMRGRTLDRAFILLDEAQNTTPKQMLMFLTRLGRRSKAVITGDLSQTDLAEGQKSGLSDVVGRLDGVEGVKVCRLGNADIVRDEMVQRIIDAYEQTGRKQ
ncbi:MAG: PhoH family protein [Planctomycetes bacterium]|nr:PhoH family protein [Planctomycetota bacterium]MCW8135257.1 PhoH family protein [Planctomycetota bacterium]